MTLFHQTSRLLTPPKGLRAATLLLAAIIVLSAFLCGRLGGMPERPAKSNPSMQGAPAAADLALYQEIVARVRGGANYYDAAYPLLKAHGFPVNSPLNWRLPTYAYFFALFPSDLAVRLCLLGLTIAGLWMAFAGETRAVGFYPALTTMLALSGVALWSIDDAAMYTQEVWAGMLLLISAAAYGLNWRSLAIAAGLAALSFRELAFPYCLVAWGIACWNRKYWQAAVWGAGLAAFFGLLYWHSGQAALRCNPQDFAGHGGISQWLRFGGIDFVLTTVRMNYHLNALPEGWGFVLFLYVACALLGLCGARNERDTLLLGSTLLYLLAFCVVGRKENMYWGLMVAPLLAFGLGRAHFVIRAWLKAGGSVSLAKAWG